MTEILEQGEYAEGLRHDDTVLVGLNVFRSKGAILRAGIANPIAYNKAKDMYFNGVVSAESLGRPPAYPSVPQGSLVPDDDAMRAVRERHPDIALWTHSEFPSFPDAAGLYFCNDIAMLLEEEAKDKGVIEECIYHQLVYVAPSANRPSVTVGFGVRDNLFQMMSAWYEFLLPRVDAEMYEMFRGRADPGRVANIIWCLQSMSYDEAKSAKRNEQCALRYILTTETENPEADLLTWNVMTKHKRDISAEELQKELQKLREKILRR